MNRGFLVGKRFLEPARMRAMRFVLVSSEAYIMAKLIPGSRRDRQHDNQDGWARIGKVAA
jgi:hypothetical protein